MSKHILFTNGVLSARYDSDVNKSIPETAIEVDDAIFWQTINETDGNWSLVKGEIVKLPFPEPTAEELQEKINKESRAYLNSTDWYVVRFAENGVEIPAEVVAARQAARDSVL
jgi:hypothetical protein